MKRLEKRMLMMAILIISTGFGCKKEKSEKVIPPTVIVPGKEEEEENSYLPLKIGSGTTSQQFSYSNSNHLSKIEYGDGTVAILTCDADNLPVTFQLLNGKVVTHESEYTLNATGQVIRIDQYIVNGARITPDGYSLLEYNSTGQLQKLSDYSQAGKLVNERSRTYTPTGNLLSESSTSTHQTATYDFDEKKAMFKYVAHTDLFALGTGDQLLNSALNNITNRKIPENSSADQTFTYVYNTKGYPQTLSYKKGTLTISNAKVVYQ